MIEGHSPQPNHVEEEERGWWEATPGDEPEPEIKPETTQATEAAATMIGLGEGMNINTILAISSGGLLFGLFSPWNWRGSGFQALWNSFSDVLFLFHWYSEWGLNPFDVIGWLMTPLLPLVFVTTFVATWYKSRLGDEEFGRKASKFHLYFFGIWYFFHLDYGVFFPSVWDYGMWIAAASGIGLHPTAYGLGEHITTWFDNR